MANSSVPSDKLINLPNGELISVDEIVKRYKKEQQVLQPVAAKVLTDKQSLSVSQNNAISFRVNWSFNDMDIQDSSVFARYYQATLDNDGRINQVSKLPDQLGLGNELYSQTSPSGRYIVYVRKATNGKESKNGQGQLIEIWRDDQHVKTLDTEAIGEYGPLYMNSKMRSIAFSPSEKFIAFIAEEKKKSESYFKESMEVAKNEEVAENSKKSKEKSRGNEYEFRQDWGENFEGFARSVVCVLQLEPELKLKVNNFPQLCPGQLFWRDEQRIGFIGYSEFPRKLGIHICNNRQSFLYYFNVKESNAVPTIVYGQHQPLQVMYPTLNNRGNQLIFLESNPCGPHLQATRLMLLDFETDKVQMLFDYQDKTSDPESLFIISLHPNCWSLDDQFIVFNTVRHSRQILCRFNIRSKRIQVLNHPLEEAQLLDFKQNLLITCGSSPNYLPTLFVANLQTEIQQVKFVALSKGTTKLNDIEYKYFKLRPESPLQQVDTIVIGLRNSFNSPTPALVIPHGGPHVSSTLSYLRNITFYVRLGLKVVLINYRGSTGINNDYLYQLCGKVGDYDVKDVMFAIESMIAEKLIKKEEITLYGGSHGGFLVTHMIGQYPNFGWRSCVAINPVVDISKMFIVTDIPDWCLVEAIGTDPEEYKRLDPNLCKAGNSLLEVFNQAINVGSSELARVMFQKSPMNYIDRVRTPVLMLLGRLDKRVPHSQGLTYQYALKARNVETKCFMYEDKHDLGKPLHNGDYIVNAVQWILAHLSQ